MGPLFSALMVLTVALAMVLAIGGVMYLRLKNSHRKQTARKLALVTAVVMTLAAVVGTGAAMALQTAFLPNHLTGWQPILYLGCGLFGGILAATMAGRLLLQSAYVTRLQLFSESDKIDKNSNSD